MKRLKWKEIHEMSWCPEFFRDCLTEFLSIIWKMGVYEQAQDKMGAVIQKTGVRLIVDLCSGAGEYIPLFMKKLTQQFPDLKAYKTDLYPNKIYFESDHPAVSYWQEPLAANDAITRFDALFTMFSALHHFDEEELAEIFETAASHRKVISFFDVSQRRWFRDILPNIFLPPMMWIATLFSKSFSWKHLLFIYLLPIAPLIVFIDGTISRMRAYKISEIETILAPLREKYPDYYFETGAYTLLHGMQKITFILGYPAEFEQNTQQDTTKTQ
ncbi:MAG: hypothetical protein J6W81_04615 [Lentisphaeria bacterium]|nr:hypothetical protein [Lentisphaeria bacterium]